MTLKLRAAGGGITKNFKDTKSGPKNATNNVPSQKATSVSKAYARVVQKYKIILQSDISAIQVSPKSSGSKGRKKSLRELREASRSGKRPSNARTTSEKGKNITVAPKNQQASNVGTGRSCTRGRPSRVLLKNSPFGRPVRPLNNKASSSQPTKVESSQSSTNQTRY